MTARYSSFTLTLSFDYLKSLHFYSIICFIIIYRVTLRKLFDEIFMVDVLDSQDTNNLFLLDRPDLGVTFTKLHCWRLEKYKKCVFLDADTLVSEAKYATLVNGYFYNALTV